MFKRIRIATQSLLLAGAMVLSTGVLPAGAATSYLCKGYTSCEDQGMPHAGYKKASKHAYWLMYKGHNCTNYVAYRMVAKGMANTRPWKGDGNAYSWGPKNKYRLDKTPVVGAVAWWKAKVKGGGSSGHVAYVERVVSADEIIISEDHWGGNFDWRRVKLNSGWPSGFIHFQDAGVGSPRGVLDAVSSPAKGKLSLRGWAYDPNKRSKGVSMRVYVGGPPGVGTLVSLKAAKVSRPDVAKAHPSLGAKHGFKQTVSVKQRGKVMIYAYALNTGKTPGLSALIGRRMVKIRS